MTFAAVQTFVSAPPAWAVMWAIAFASFFSLKWLSWARHANSHGGSATDAAAYFLAWPGMDPAAFLRRDAGKAPDLGKLLTASVRIVCGVVLIALFFPRLRVDHPTLAGAVGMAALVLILHFGVFDVMNAVWRMRGVDAVPLMNAPTRATSLADFWGNRWNTAFHDLARTLVFMPLRRPLGVAGATMATFLASGVVHDLVITVPARGGYGLPTLYFLIQGVGVLFERTRLARREWHRKRCNVRTNVATFSVHGAGVRNRMGRVYAALFVIAPVPLLFPEPFLTRVILPFLEVIR
jgi:alginate O-acetyltransferase complex protein AlgI